MLADNKGGRSPRSTERKWADLDSAVDGKGVHAARVPFPTAKSADTKTAGLVILFPLQKSLLPRRMIRAGQERCARASNSEQPAVGFRSTFRGQVSKDKENNAGAENQTFAFTHAFYVREKIKPRSENKAIRLLLRTRVLCQRANKVM